MAKDFKTWGVVKTSLESREVWHCHLGENLGHEEGGKGSAFLRPVVVVRVFSQDLFWAVPITSTEKVGEYYHSFLLAGRRETALLTQSRVLDRKRLLRKVGHIPRSDFELLVVKITALLGS